MPAATTTTNSSSSTSNSTSASPSQSSSHLASPTCSTTTLPPSDALLRADINRRLLESGEYEKLSSHVTLLLRESGWRESTLHTCNRLLRDPCAKVINYQTLYAAVERDAMEGVDGQVKVEVVKRIREALEGMVEA
ncbi:hypothetical protein EV426DRAFT_62567 [Tirmania nivea]|nr:hypothetical protein EV426DRAFT_62567 [Tirmania nivea]